MLGTPKNEQATNCTKDKHEADAQAAESAPAESYDNISDGHHQPLAPLRLKVGTCRLTR